MTGPAALAGVAWSRRALVVLATLGSASGAVLWWRDSDQSIGWTTVLVLFVVGTAVPAFVPGPVGFAAACRTIGLLLIMVSVVLSFFLLVWVVLGAVVVLLAGEATGPRSGRVLLVVGAVIALGTIGLFVASLLR